MVADRSDSLISAVLPETNSGCPVCDSHKLRTRYQFDWGQILQCGSCTCAFADGVDFDDENESAFRHGDSFEDISLYRQWAGERLSTLLKFKSSGTLLEFGPGTGEFLHAAATAGFTVTGVDRFPRLRNENNHPAISIVQSDARSFRSDRPFDVVAAIHVLEHFSNPYDFLASIRASLGENGLVLIEVPNYASLSRIAIGSRWNCFVKYHALQLTPAGIEFLLKKAGFNLVQIESVGCATTQVIGLGIPWLFRRIGLRIKNDRKPWNALTPLATKVERQLHLGNNLRVVARKA